MQMFIHASEQISLFCRIHINTKRNIPIRSSELGLLIYLVKSDGGKTPMDAARFFRVTKAMTANMVTALTRQGYLTREQSEEDKRSYQLIPTQKAVDLVETTYSDYYRNMALLEERMGEEDFSSLIRLVEKANTILLEDKE